MKKVVLDYIFRTSSRILFKRLSTASGLSEWFADDVTVNNGIFTFRWKNYEQQAKYLIDSKNLYVKFDWLDEDKEFMEFKIEPSKLTKDLTLYITDFVEDDEDEQDARELWDNLIKRFKRKIGLS